MLHHYVILILVSVNIVLFKQLLLSSDHLWKQRLFSVSPITSILNSVYLSSYLYAVYRGYC